MTHSEQDELLRNGIFPLQSRRRERSIWIPGQRLDYYTVLRVNVVFYSAKSRIHLDFGFVCVCVRVCLGVRGLVAIEDYARNNALLHYYYQYHARLRAAASSADV